MAFSNSASPEIIWGLGGPEEDHQLHHCCWTGRVSVSEREEEEEDHQLHHCCWTGRVGEREEEEEEGHRRRCCLSKYQQLLSIILIPV